MKIFHRQPSYTCISLANTFNVPAIILYGAGNAKSFEEFLSFVTFRSFSTTKIYAIPII